MFRNVLGEMYFCIYLYLKNQFTEKKISLFTLENKKNIVVFILMVYSTLCATQKSSCPHLPA